MTAILSATGVAGQGEPFNLTDHPSEDRTPVWSPDGRRLLFESDRDGNRELYSVGADGTGLRRLTTNEGLDILPAWSPRGDRIVFQSERQGISGLWIMSLGDGEARLLVEDASPELTPDWSPDGSAIAFTSTRSGSVNLWVVDADGGAPEQLTNSDFRDAWPRWSPDGGSLLFFSRRDTGGERDELYVMDWGTRHIRRLTDNPTHHDFAPGWSPDGRRVVTGLSDAVSDRALAIYELDGRRLHRFAEGYHRVFQPAWSPDGESIAYAARVEDGRAADIFIVAAPVR